MLKIFLECMTIKSFSTKGRTSRWKFFCSLLICILTFILAYFLSLTLISLLLAFDVQDNTTGGTIICAFILSLWPLIACFFLHIRRLHDLDLTGWWIIAKLIPHIDIIVLLILFFKKGSEGENRFGPPPTE